MNKAILIFIALAACATPPSAMTAPIVLHHPTTGATVQCGPFKRMASGAHAFQESQCIGDYQRQGFERSAVQHL